MENKNQNTVIFPVSPGTAGSGDIPVANGALGNTPPNNQQQAVDTLQPLSLDQAPVFSPSSPAAQPGTANNIPLVTPSQPAITAMTDRGASRIAKWAGAALILLLILGVVAFMANTALNRSSQETKSVAEKYESTELPLTEFQQTSEDGLEFTSQTVTINGALVISPTTLPTAPTAGQLYYDGTNNVLAYYNGAEFVPLVPGSQQTTQQIVTGGGVQTVQGQTGNVAFSAGNGIALDGTTISNTGVTSITSTNPQLTVSTDTSGNATLGLIGAGSGTVTSSGGTVGTIPLFTDVQNIENSILTQSGGAITVGGNLSVSGGLSLSTPLSVGNGGTGRTSFTANGVLVGNGTGGINTVVAGGADMCLKSTGGAPIFDPCVVNTQAVTQLNGLTGSLTINNATGVVDEITINDASTSQKGIAQFNGTNFTAGSGIVNLVQNIHTGATPTFAGLTLNGTLSMGANNITGNNFSVQGSTGNINTSGTITSGLINGQTISSSANFTGTVTVASNVTLTSGDLAVNGGDITSSGALNITPGGTLTVGATGQALVLQGNGSTQLTATSGGNTTTIGFETPTANTVINFPTSSAGTYTVCTTASNCSTSGTAGGDLTGTYPNPTIASLQGTALAITTPNAGDMIIWNGTDSEWQNHALSGDVTISETGVVTIGNGAVSNANLENSSITINAGVGLTTGGNVALGSSVTLDLADTTVTPDSYGSASSVGTFTVDQQGRLTGAASVPIAIAGTQITSGTINDLRLSPNVTLQGNTFNGASQLVQLNGSTQLPAVSGVNLTNLNASNLASGTVPVGRLTGSYTGITGVGTISTGIWEGTAVAIDYGGTGATTAQGAINALAGLTTEGDLLYHDGSDATRLARGAENECLVSTASSIQWASCSSGGGISGAGTSGQVAYFNGTGSITSDGDLLFDGTTLTANTLSVTANATVGGTLAIQGASATIGGASQTGSLVLHDGNGGQTTTIRAGNSSGNLTFILPVNTGAASQCLKQSGTGNQLIWDDCEGGGGGVSGVTSVNSLDGALTVQGTAGEIDVADNGSDTITLSAGANVTLQGNTFNGASQLVQLNGSSELPVASGVNLTNLNASNLASGTVPVARLSGSYTGITGVGTIAAGTWQGTAVADPYVADDLTISSSGSVDWLALTNYPTGCSTGEAVTAVGDTLTCAAFAADSGSGSYIQNGTSLQAAANFNIQSAATTSVTANFQVLTSQTADVLRVRNAADDATLFAVSPAGNVSAAGTLSIAGTSSLTGAVTLGTQASTTNQAVRADRSISTNNGLTGGGNLTADRTLSLTGQALALHNLNTTGIIVRTGTDTVTTRSIAVGTGLSVSNGDGVSGNPTISFATTGTGAPFLQGGNSFGATAVLGTNDSNSVTIETNNTTQATIAVGGATTFRNSADSANAFQVQNASNAAILNVNTSTGMVSVANLDVAGTLAAGTADAFQVDSDGDITTAGDLAVNGGNITSSGALNITPGGSLTVGATGQTLILQGNTSTVLTATDSGNTTTLSFVTPIADVTLQLPALPAGTYEICTDSGNCDSGTLQNAYDNSVTPEIVLDATRGAVTIRDAATPIAGALLEIQSNDGATTYFAVDDGGIAVTGTIAASGNISTTTGVLNINGQTRIDNNGNLQNIGNLTASGAITVSSTGGGSDLTLSSADQIILNSVGTIELQDATNITGNLGVSGLINQNTFTSSSLQFGNASTATIQPAASQALNITAHASSTWSTDSGNLSLQAAGALNLGNGGGTTINIGTNAAAHTIAIGTDATAAQSITIGSANASSSSSLLGSTVLVESQGTLSLGANAVAQVITVGNGTGATSVSVQCGTGTCGFGNNATAHTTVLGSTTSTSTTNIQAGTGGISIVSGANITLGTSNTTGTLLVLDTKTDSGDPTGVSGGMYYNSNSGKFRCYQDSLWRDCIAASAAEYLRAERLAFQNGTQVDSSSDHVNFDTVQGSSGSSITLDTTSPYTEGGGASQGRFTLTAGKTYRLRGTVGSASFNASTGYVISRWYDVTNGVAMGSAGEMFPSTYSGSHASSSSMAEAIISPSTTTIVELRLIDVDNIASLSDATLSANAFIEMLSDGTQIGQFIGATDVTNGQSGYVPAPLAGQEGSVLLGNGTWSAGVTFINGEATFQNLTDSVNAFQVLDETGSILAFGVNNITGNVESDYDLIINGSIQAGTDLIVEGDTDLQGDVTVGGVSNSATAFRILDGLGNAMVTVDTTVSGAVQINGILGVTEINTRKIAIAPTSNDAQSFAVQNASAVRLFTVDTTNSRVSIGHTSADGTGALLILDTKNTSGDPTGVNGGMYYNSNTSAFRCFEASAWHNCAGGTLGYAENTTGQIGISNTITDLTGLSTTVTVPANHRIRITGQINAIGDVVNDTYELLIREGSTTHAECFTEASSRIGVPQIFTCSVVLTPTSGSHTYKLSFLRVLGGGTNTGYSAQAGRPAYILVEDIGK